MRRENKAKRKLSQRIADFCEVPTEYIPHLPLFIIKGRGEIEVEGCSGIREYTAEKIVLAVGRDKFTVRGNGLTLCDFQKKILYIRGNITSAVFGEEEDV